MDSYLKLSTSGSFARKELDLKIFVLQASEMKRWITFIGARGDLNVAVRHLENAYFAPILCEEQSSFFTAFASFDDQLCRKAK